LRAADPERNAATTLLVGVRRVKDACAGLGVICG
jgi:hypothetical protein